MSLLVGKGGLREIEIQATVLGPCRYCGDGAEFWSNNGCKHEPTFVRELGPIARWHRNPLVRLYWRIKDKIRRH